jgi:hypothetical protein
LDALARLDGADTQCSLHFHCLSHGRTCLPIRTRVTKVNLHNFSSEMSEDFIKVLNSFLHNSKPYNIFYPLRLAPQWGFSLIA